MTPHRLSPLLMALVLTAASLAWSTPARAAGESISGVVTDGISGAPIADVCVTLGPPIVCFTRTDGNGQYVIGLEALAAPPGSTWDMYFLKQPTHQTAYSEIFTVSGPVTWNQVLMPVGQRELCPAERTASAAQTVYLPNVTKTFGGASGWQTPFIIQNTGVATTTLEITYKRFLNSACAVRRTVTDLGPGTSFADVPNNDNDLPGNTQFAVVIRSFGGSVVSVVNQHAGGGARAEAMAYVGASSGSTSVFLPNIVRRFFGYVTPFIIQNLGTTETTATAQFTSFDGSAPTVTVTRTIPAGGSKFVDPNSDDSAVGAPGLIDGKQYAVRVTSAQQVSVIVNTHNDAPSVSAPVAYATNGIRNGAARVYGPYAAKNAQGTDRVSTIVVQNLSTASITPTLTFTPLGGGTDQVVTSPAAVAPGGAWAFDPRFEFGTTTPCGAGSATCLGNGEYSFVASSGSTTREIAVAVNVIGSSTAMGYTALRNPTDTVSLPNVTRTLGGAAGWTTPIVLQGVTATSATLRWYRFSDGALVHTQSIVLGSGSAKRIDPREVAELADNNQYAVVATSSSGTIAAIVVEEASGGDNAMIYEGFAR